jgi:hypothetical protein
MMSKLEYVENPTEADFPLIDRCSVCNEICDWQPRYEAAARTAEHCITLADARPVTYVVESRTVKICAECVDDCGTNDNLRRLIRKQYPAYAKRKGI